MHIQSLVTLALFSGSIAANAQENKKPKLINDEFNGTISASSDVEIATALKLTHEPYADDGTFLLNEVYDNSKTKSKNALVREGEWTVLKGSATDENATVVELDDKNQKPIYYYLRLKNGDLQQLDNTLHIINPVTAHMLAKRPTDKRTIVVKPTHQGQKQ